MEMSGKLTKSFVKAMDYCKSLNLERKFATYKWPQFKLRPRHYRNPKGHLRHYLKTSKGKSCFLPEKDAPLLDYFLPVAIRRFLPLGRRTT
ncbi:hypothetical protein HNY73_018835 [Argiope bruennichi]|uniref:Uncharacterized protein n=1 Tax=Argiope bruennichi TaxID=94029 RepID=A0A8T0EFK0_ARGBR|nr:hypothetical protein HNY73_018835 [Argiope bruennichi]